jgi:hypothetical protein
MRTRRKITTDKLHEVFVVFEKPTEEQEFKRSKKYKQIVDYIKINDFILDSEHYESSNDPEWTKEDYLEEPDHYRFSFLVKKHAKAVAKEFGLEMLTLDTEGECWWHWPDYNDLGDPGNSFMPDGMSFDECMEIYGDIPGDRG